MADIKVSEMQSTTNLNPDDLIMVVQSGSNKKATFDLFKEIPIDNLNSTSTTDALSANQGKILNDSITNINSKITSLTTYSTDEVKTGETWIDGKPLYRKVINFGNLPNNSSKAIGIGVANLGTVTKIEGLAVGSQYTFPMPYVSTTNIALNIDLHKVNNNIEIITGTDRSSYTAYIIIEYTKTTD